MLGQGPALSEPVHHDLIHEPITHPVRGVVGGVVHGDLVAGGLPGILPAHAAHPVGGVAVPHPAQAGIGDEVIPQGAGGVGQGKVHRPQPVPGVLHGQQLLRVLPPQAQGDLFHRGMGLQAQCNGRTARPRAGGRAVHQVTRVVVQHITNPTASDAKSFHYIPQWCGRRRRRRSRRCCEWPS